MNKKELRNEFIKQIPKSIISGKQQSYADWLEDKLINTDFPSSEQIKNAVRTDAKKQTSYDAGFDRGKGFEAGVIWVKKWITNINGITIK